MVVPHIWSITKTKSIGTSRFMTIESAPQRRTWQQAGWWGRVAASIEAGKANSDWPTPPTLYTSLYAQSTNPKGYKRMLYILELLFNIFRTSPVWFWVDVSQQWRWVKKFDKSSSFTWLKFVSHWLWDKTTKRGAQKSGYFSWLLPLSVAPPFNGTFFPPIFYPTF